MLEEENPSFFDERTEKKITGQGKIKAEVGKILRTLCERKGVEILEAEACPNHIHMLVSIQPKYSVSEFMGYLKGKSSPMIFDKVCEHEVPIWESTVLVQRVLCEYGRTQ